MTPLRNIWNRMQHQDLIEYALLIVFVILASIALLSGAEDGIRGIW
jgi:hypothetical protein